MECKEYWEMIRATLMQYTQMRLIHEKKDSILYSRRDREYSIPRWLIVMSPTPILKSKSLLIPKNIARLSVSPRFRVVVIICSGSFKTVVETGRKSKPSGMTNQEGWNIT